MDDGTRHPVHPTPVRECECGECTEPAIGVWHVGTDETACCAEHKDTMRPIDHRAVWVLNGAAS
jgi:hypothetical protein